VAHYDEEVTGRLPVPSPVSRRDIPLLIFALSSVGLPLETAGLANLSPGILVTIWLIWDVGLMLGARPPVLAAVALLWIRIRRR